MSNNKLIELKRNEYGVPMLTVNGAPFLVQAGESFNSSASKLEYMSDHVWPKIKGLNLNTLIIPIYWELIEPKENAFEFDLVRGLIDQAREEEIHLVLLWFGLWKNGESFYVPDWVKTDTSRFTRIQTGYGELINTISPLCSEAVAADEKAFSKLAACLAEYDKDIGTVLMLQVENEIGVLGSDRDYSDEAERLFTQRIPDEVRSFIDRDGTWSEAFGEEAPEYFMAYHYATAVQQIAQSGKREYDIPLYVNAWLKQFPELPGVYPSGGPVSHLISFWKQFTPTIDFIAPDIYVSDFDSVCLEYNKDDNILFIPEARRDGITASNFISAICKHGAIGFSPFGIEGINDNFVPASDNALAQLNIDRRSFIANNTGKWIAHNYQLFERNADFILSNRGAPGFQAFMKKSSHDRGIVITTSLCDIIITYQDERLDGDGLLFPGTAGFVYEDQEEALYICGCNFQYSFVRHRNSNDSIFIIRIEEGEHIGPNWISTRILNGDELNKRKFDDYSAIHKIRVMRIKN